MLALSRQEVQAFDRWAIEQLGVPGVVLMENAGRGSAEVLFRAHAEIFAAGGSVPEATKRPEAGVAITMAITGRTAGPRPGLVVVCCGRGNNGGDGYVMARYLAIAGVAVRVLAFADPDKLTGDARWAAEVYHRLGWTVIPLWQAPLDEARLRQELAEADWVVDALFGTGLQGPLRPPYDRIVEILNASGKPILAVDIPSGLDCDTGQPLGPTIQACCTATMAACKRGFLAPGASAFIGQVYVVSLGVPVEAWLSSRQGSG